MTDATYTGEAMLLRWADSSTQGRTVTFIIEDGPDAPETHPFKGLPVGKDGQRFAIVAVPLAEDQHVNDSAVGADGGYSVLPTRAPSVIQPEAGSGATGRPAPHLLVQMAGILPTDGRFQMWALAKHGSTKEIFAEAAQWLRHHCNIASRRELATNEAAAEKFRALVARYKSETGQTTEQRS